MEQVLAHFDLLRHKPNPLQLRPQCPNCSANQGGKMSNITRLALDLAPDLGILSYKYGQSSNPTFSWSKQS